MTMSNRQTVMTRYCLQGYCVSSSVRRVFGNCGRKTTSCFVLFITCGIVMLLILAFNKSQLHSSSRPALNEAHLEADEKTNHEGMSAVDANFTFLATIYSKIHAGWLQGRTTQSKAYFDELYISLTNDIYLEMQKSDKQRWSQLRNLSRVVRERIDSIQNPPNCSEAQLLVYNIRQHECGFGCSLHNIILFFMQSIYANRTFVLQSAGWKYDRKGWEHYLLPFGKCAYESSALRLPLLSNKTKHIRVVTTSVNLFGKIDLAVPATILSRLKNVHWHPYVWWIGQFVAYVFKIQPWYLAQLQEFGNRIGFTDKTLGIQVRWGDKLDETAPEALKHEVDEYMGFVETWFRMQDVGNEKVERVVFVATENSQVWIDLKTRYPEYRFIGSGYVNESQDLEPEKNGEYDLRKNAITSIIADLYFLSKCGYIVCTLSSNVCRAAYELSMLETSDSLNRIQSLDKPYHLYSAPWYTVMESYKASDDNEVSVEVDDVIFTWQNPYVIGLNGSQCVIVEKSGEYGEVPKYKLKDAVYSYESPIFDDL